mmetsp:Transcript_69704/g.105309  ORF Transcript_69704/g.105309 Transcript_69704/m.105309 type:complete len:213 (+) Transcript_69704:237-875(+)
MRNHDRRPALLLEQVVKRRLHHPLALVVQRARRLVQQQDRRVLDHRPRDRDPLLLPPRQLPALLPNVGLVAFREGEDEVVGVGHLGRRDHLLPRRAVLAVCNVVGNRPAEQHRLLPHHPDLLPQPVHVERLQVPPVQLHHPRVRVVEALDQLHRRALPAPARPHQRHRRPGLHRQAVPVRHLLVGPAGVREVHVVEADLPLHAPRLVASLAC